jgi:hypothetical protein
MKKFLLLTSVIFITATACNSSSKAPSDPIRKPYIEQGCDCPYDLMKNGKACGDFSAYSKPGGKNPICYVKDQQSSISPDSKISVTPTPEVAPLKTPIEIPSSGRDLVLIGESNNGTKYYVWQNTIRHVQNFVWWTEEVVRYDYSGKLQTHRITERYGDCVRTVTRVEKNRDYIDGEVITTPGELLLTVPGSLGEAALNHVCGKTN